MFQLNWSILKILSFEPLYDPLMTFFNIALSCLKCHTRTFSQSSAQLKKGDTAAKRETKKGDTAAVSGSWKLPLPAPATTVAKNQCLTCCLTCCFWCWISHWVLLILSWNMWLRGRSWGLWFWRDPGGVGGSVKIGDWVFDLVGVFPWLRSFGLTFRLLVLREYSYLGVFLSAVTIWSMPFVLVSCC